MLNRDNLELLVLGVLSAIGIIVIAVMFVLEAPPPDVLLGLVAAIVGALLKELGESGQLAKSERVLGQQTLEVHG